MNNSPRSRYQNNQPKNQCWGCGKLLVITMDRRFQLLHDDKVNYGSTIHGYACDRCYDPYRDDDGEETKSPNNR